MPALEQQAEQQRLSPRTWWPDTAYPKTQHMMWAGWFRWRPSA